MGASNERDRERGRARGNSIDPSGARRYCGCMGGGVGRRVECAHEVYVAIRQLAHRALDASRPRTLDLLRRRIARRDGTVRDFATLALDDVERRIPRRARIHICRACQGCALVVNAA